MACHSFSPRLGGVAAAAAAGSNWFATLKSELAIGLLFPWLDPAFAC